MIYYRVALRANESAEWRWKSTVVTSLEAVLGLIKLYTCVPKDRIRVFFASSVETMNVMLARVNKGPPSNSMLAEQFLNGKRISPEDIARLESEACTQENKVPVSTPVLAASAVNEKRASMNGAEFG